MVSLVKIEMELELVQLKTSDAYVIQVIFVMASEDPAFENVIVVASIHRWVIIR